MHSCVFGTLFTRVALVYIGCRYGFANDLLRLLAYWTDLLLTLLIGRCDTKRKQMAESVNN